MRKHFIDGEFKIVVSGVLLSILVNLLFYFNGSVRPLTKFQYQICINLPLMLGCVLGAIGFIVVCILRGNTSFADWGKKQANDILNSKCRSFRKTMAKIYLMLIIPSTFLAAWLMGCVFYGALVTDPKFLIFALAVMSGMSYLSKILLNKYAQKKQETTIVSEIEATGYLSGRRFTREEVNA